MNELLEIEKIKQLKGRYFRFLDTNDWDALGTTFSDDCVSSYSGGEHSYVGRDAIIKFLSESMSGDKFLSMHHGHTPEITITSETTATGVWYLQDLLVLSEINSRLYGAGIYADEYAKIDGEWVHTKIGYERTFECMEPLPEGHQILQNMWAK